jgi:hypothetical protein
MSVVVGCGVCGGGVDGGVRGSVIEVDLDVWQAMAFRGGQQHRGPPQDRKVGSQADLFDVFLVEADLVVLVKVAVLDEFELGVAGEAWSYVVAASASAGLDDVLGEEWSWANETHGAGEEVEDLGQLVESQTPEDPAVAGEPVSFPVGAPTAGWSGHSAQLDQAKGLAVPADAPLGEQHRRALAQHAREGSHGEDRERRAQKDQSHGQVK